MWTLGHTQSVNAPVKIRHTSTVVEDLEILVGSRAGVAEDFVGGSQSTGRAGIASSSGDVEDMVGVGRTVDGTSVRRVMTGAVAVSAEVGRDDVDIGPRALRTLQVHHLVLTGYRFIL